MRDVSTLVRGAHSMRWTCSDETSCAEVSFVRFLVDYFWLWGRGVVILIR